MPGVGGRLSSVVWVTVVHLYCQCLLSWSNNVLFSIVLSSILVKTVTKTTLGSTHTSIFPVHSSYLL